jgi:hypothetical protein
VTRELVDRIAKAVLYEGYMLYPYRPSATKNRQRFNFGVVYPRVYSEQQNGADAWTMQTECLVKGSPETACQVCVRFLRLVERSIGRLRVPVDDPSSIDERNLESVERLEAGGKSYAAWQEATEIEVEVTPVRLADLASKPLCWPFRFSSRRETEPIRGAKNEILGVVVRRQEELTGQIELSAAELGEGVVRLTAVIANSTDIDGHEEWTREGALTRALVSAHTILEVRDGEFVSLIDPPEELRESARLCRNVGSWPVLVGEEGQHDTMLSSPIILYDYPQVAPESPGDLFDGAEIDEILSLRILTMTEEEKREMRQSDERAREILERTEHLPAEQLRKLHGVLREWKPLGGQMP